MIWAVKKSLHSPSRGLTALLGGFILGSFISVFDPICPLAADWSRDARIPVTGRPNPLGLSRTELLASVRARLRRDHSFPREAGRRFGVTAICSREQPASGRTLGGAAGAPLACAGYGSAVTVTATMGLAAAAWVIDAIVNQAS